MTYFCHNCNGHFEQTKTVNEQPWGEFQVCPCGSDDFGECEVCADCDALYIPGLFDNGLCDRCELAEMRSADRRASEFQEWRERDNARRGREMASEGR